MEIIVVLAIGVAAYFLIMRKIGKQQRYKSFSASRGATNAGLASGQSFLPPMVSGYQIYADRLPVAGIQFRKIEALKFANGNNQELKLQRETDNEHDPNAIRLIGVAGLHEYFIGYLPKELSEQIVLTGLFDAVKARLARIYVSSDDYVDIQYQVIGPKSKKKEFDDFLKSQPADASQKEYFKFFGLPTPKRMTSGQAEQTIFEHTKNCTPDEIAEWAAYSNILDEFDDKDFRETYDLKKVSKAVLLDAIKQLKVEGKTYGYLEENMDELVDRIIALRPELER